MGENNGNLERRLERLRAWRSPVAILTAGLTAFLTLSGLVILLAPFSVANQINVIAHTLGGLLFLVPCGWYLARHWRQYWRHSWSHHLVLGYMGGAALLLCVVSGVVLTLQATLGRRISYGWDTVHIVTTFAILAFAAPHVLVLALRDRKARPTSVETPSPATVGHYGRGLGAITLAGAGLILLAAFLYPGLRLQKEFPADYSFKYGAKRPFAPSMARTDDSMPMDDRLLSGSLTCGTSGCHEQIVQEWEPSAHRYAAMDTAFQKIQMNMAQQNGPESTRYCGGCHDPISLFSGAKNLFVADEKLTSLHGFQEGVSCLACHSVRQVDVKGNANYWIARPARYLFEIEYAQKPRGATRFVRDFLIRSYPKQHMKDLSKRLFKTPEYCAACHKQFIDKEINNVGWVQLQNQYDNWRQSRWNHPTDATKRVECRECHMPLVPSTDPAAGDPTDYNRSADDSRHRSHRFIAANQLMPPLLKLRGWQQQVALTEKWLRGGFEIPEIANKWRNGAVVTLDLIAPEKVRAGEKVDLKLVMGSNKVGHDFPTGPLDIIQSWLQVIVKDDQGRVLFSRGLVDPKGFIQPGTFMFKAEPVDQNGNLIDRHNLWEMVGVRYRRSLFPGFSDTAEFSFFCPSLVQASAKTFPQEVAYPLSAPVGANSLHVEARLLYRKVDQYLLNFMFGEQAGLTAPVTEMAIQTRRIALERGSGAGPDDE